MEAPGGRQRSPSRRARGTSSGGEHAGVLRDGPRAPCGAGSTAPDPVLQLMMSSLLERQHSLSASGGACSKQPAAACSKQPAAACSSSTAGAGAARGARGCQWLARLWQLRWGRWLLLAVAALLLAATLAVAVPLGVQAAAARAAAAAAARQRAMRPPATAGPRLDTSGMQLVWWDDFTRLDAATWSHDLGDGADYALPGWGNAELQCYTNSPDNVDVLPHPDYPDLDGVLRIRPVRLPSQQPCINRVAPASSGAGQWTSGKIHTKDKVAFTWAGQQVLRGPTGAEQPGAAAAAGRRLRAAAEPAGGANSSSCPSLLIEARMRLPLAAGRWSALWMMPRPRACLLGQPGECGAFGPWPASGEIDILEQVNTNAELISNTHFTQPPGVHGSSGGTLQLAPAELGDWIVVQLAWSCDALAWYANGRPVARVARQQLLAQGVRWPFDEPFYLIINVAVGGLLTGGAAPDDSAGTRPLLVDYVRVYAAPAGGGVA